MSEIRSWLAVNEQRLDEIARRTGTETEVVHLEVVLALAGLSDDQICNQLAALEVRLRDGHDRRHDRAALAEIRSLLGAP